MENGTKIRGLQRRDSEVQRNSGRSLSRFMVSVLHPILPSLSSRGGQERHRVGLFGYQRRRQPALGGLQHRGRSDHYHIQRG